MKLAIVIAVIVTALTALSPAWKAHAGNCFTTCQMVGNYQYCTTQCD
jgi:hypothetical protein